MYKTLVGHLCTMKKKNLCQPVHVICVITCETQKISRGLMGKNMGQICVLGTPWTSIIVGLTQADMHFPVNNFMLQVLSKIPFLTVIYLPYVVAFETHRNLWQTHA